MENNGSSKVYILLALVAGLAGGYYYGSTVYYNKGYEQARTEIKTNLENKRIIEPTAKDVRVISGKIISINGNQFVLESQLPFDPTMPEGQQVKTIIKTVIVVSATEISTRTVEANKAIQKAGEAFRPFIVKDIKIKLNDLKIADAVVVEAGENIADKTSFNAVTIFKNGQ